MTAKQTHLDVAPDRQPFRRRGRILFTLLAVLVFIGLAPLATVAWKLIDINREALVTATQETQLLVASSVAREVDIHVQALEDELVRVAQTVGGTSGRRLATRAQRQDVQRVLTGLLDERTLYLRFNAFQGGTTRAIAAGELPDHLEPLFESGFEEAVKILAQDSRTAPEMAIVSEPSILANSQPRRAVMVISAPVVSGGRFAGVLSALVDFQQVWKSVVSGNRGGIMYALDHTGQVIASTHPARILPGTERARTELVVRFLTAQVRAAETMPFVETVDGRELEYIGSYQVTDQGWGVFVQARLQDVYLPVQRMIESTAAWALFVLGLSVVAAVFFAGTLSRPIKRLAAASRAFASGDFNARVQIRSGNEIGELAYTFNRMAAEIEDHIRRLRQAAEENRELFLGTIRALAQAIDAKDPYTRGHSVRVNRYSIVIARQLGLSEEQIADIHVASLMHDVGKIGIHDAILQKPGKLTPEEFDVMKTHTTQGAQIMQPIRQMARVIPGLRSHHERWKGGGYPDGLQGEEIPFMARVIAVADTFDAMTTHRPYQQAMTYDKAVETLNALKGVAFDERVIEAFNRAYTQGRIVDRSAQPAAEPTPAPSAASN